jgi:outer membrane protein OmpA-like peptidoglycan-associated protein
MGRLPILSAALLSAGGLMWDGVWSRATAQTYSGASNEVVVNYDVLNSLPGQAAPYGSQGARVGTPPQSQFLPGYAPGGYNQGGYAPGGISTTLPPYTPYGQVPPAGVQGGVQAVPLAPGLAPGLAAPPSRAPSSVLTTLGPDGRPITPIKLKKPGSTQKAQKPKKEYAAPVQKPQAPDSAAEPTPEPADSAAAAPADDTQVAAVTPPTEPAAPAEVPAEVPMPEPTPQPPASGVNADQAPAAPAVETPAAPVEAAVPAEAPAAEEQAAQEQPAAETPAEPAAEAAAPAEAEPTEEAAAETPPEPDSGQPAPPIPQGGIRIVFPTELNEVPSEANAALDDLAAQMQADESMRIQIMCYASGTEDTESKARRKSLARCINIRQYLFKKDVRTTRMDVRALGLKSEGQPADRVDIVPAAS